ncbi:MAG TPA: two-component regulator propeller domain-containing protein [Opitutaceae bacterium]|nr:two-component regulator propeller domain-containing protein [Opitutaceae bacterium]
MKLPAFVQTVLVSAMIVLADGLAPVSAQDQDAPDRVILSLTVGKDIRFTTLTGEEGLPSANVFGIAQDSRGFLWFATGDGLSRYDGNAFRTFRFERGNPNSLSGNTVHAIERARGDVLWLATTSGGLDRFDPVTETFTRYRHEPENTNSLSVSGIRQHCLVEDRTGGLWIGTMDGGLNRLDPTTGTFTHYRHDPQDANSLSSDQIAYLYQDSGGMMWIGTADAGLNRLDPASGQVTRYLPNPADPHALPDPLVQGIYEDRAGTLWVATRERFGVLDRQSGRFTQYHIAPSHPDSPALNAIVQFHEDAAGTLWLGARGAGIFKFDRLRRQVVHYRNVRTDPHSLRNNFTGSLHEDPSGTLWVGTLGGGANMFSTRPPKFAHYKHDPDNPNSVADNFIFSIFEDHAGIVWIGTSRTLNRWDRESDTWRFYRNDPADPASITTGSVTATQEDPDGTLWFGTFRGGLNRFDPKTGDFKAYRFDANDPRSLSDDIVRSLHRDSNGNLWVGCWYNGLSRFDRRTETFERYPHDPGNPNSLSGGSVTDIYEDRAKTLWVATEGGGLNRFDPATGEFARFKNDPQDLTSLANDDVRVLCEDRAGQFWVGTAGGLCLFDRASGTCPVVFTKADGLPNDTIAGILEDESGNLWISTNDGLSRFDPRTGIFRNFDTSDGLQDKEFHVFTAFYKSPRTGEMYFGGVNGFNVFDPSRVVNDPFEPPVAFTDFRLFGKSVPVGSDSVLRKTIDHTDRLTLPHDQNSLSFEFAALSYVAPAKNQYRYRLEGFDPGWRTVGSKERLAVYTGLHPGHYVFRVQGSNEDGVWSEAGASIAIAIIPPWWQTWWFRFAAAGMLAAVAWSAYGWRIRSIHTRNVRLEREVATRTAELRHSQAALVNTVDDLNRKSAALETANKELEAFSYSVSHDLRAPLRSIDGFSQILLEDCADKLGGEGQEYLQTIRAAVRRMGALIDDMLRLARISRSEMRMMPVDLSVIATEISHALQQEEPQRAVEFSIQPGCVVTGDASLLRIALDNLLSNAWKYTSKQPNARIEFGVSATAAGDTFFVRDNGCGFDMKYVHRLFRVFQRLHTDQEYAGSGIGLASVQRVIQRHGGRVWIEGELGVGATLYFTLPNADAVVCA